MFMGVGESVANKLKCFWSTGHHQQLPKKLCLDVMCKEREWQHAWKNYQTMAKCLAIFKGTSVKLKTLVARSAVMFVFSTLKINSHTHTNRAIILIPFLFIWTLTLVINGVIPFIDDLFYAFAIVDDVKCGARFDWHSKVLKCRTMKRA